MRIVHAGKAKGLPIAVASAGTRKHVQQSLEEAGITELFDAIVCGGEYMSTPALAPACRSGGFFFLASENVHPPTSDDVANGKPAPDLFLLAAQKIGVQPHLCVGYEDAKLGMQAIANAGFLIGIDVTVFEGYPMLC